jgi:hypothetical protein
VLIAGKSAGTLSVAADSYQSLVLHDGTLVVLDDSAASDDALKAELRFYNLASDCPAGQLQVQAARPCSPTWPHRPARPGRSTR